MKLISVYGRAPLFGYKIECSVTELEELRWLLGILAKRNDLDARVSEAAKLYITMLEREADK